MSNLIMDYLFIMCVHFIAHTPPHSTLLLCTLTSIHKRLIILSYQLRWFPINHSCYRSFWGTMTYFEQVCLFHSVEYSCQINNEMSIIQLNCQTHKSDEYSVIIDASE